MKTKITKTTILKFFGILLLILVLSVLILFAVVIGRTFTFKVNTELGQWENATTIYPSLSPEQKKQLLENFKGKKRLIISKLYLFRNFKCFINWMEKVIINR